MMRRPIGRARWRELLHQGYDDAYRQFIEPVVAAGERVSQSDLSASTAVPVRDES